MRAWISGCSVGAMAIGLAAPGSAQVAPTENPAPSSTQATRTTSYDAAFFAPAAPRSALDIARRVPGFSLDLGNNETRGFAGAAGNVVINGARPSSKAESLETTLARLPARSVVRVEVGPGDLYGAEYSSKSQVLNVILSADKGVDGNVTASARRLYTGYVNRDISGSVQIKRGTSSINVSGGLGRNFAKDGGTDTLTDLVTGAVLEFRRKQNNYNNKDPYVSGSWALERAADDAIRLNARWSPSKVDFIQYNRVRTAGEDPHDDNLIQRYRNPVFELGGDVTRPLAGGAIKFVGLATRRKRDNLDAYLERAGLDDEDDTIVGGFEQVQTAKRGETIGRINWTRSKLAGFSVEVGAEGVLNTLDSETELFLIQSNGDRTRIDLPIDQAEVKEKRGDVYFSIGHNLTPKFRIDGGLNYEFSRIIVTGDTQARRALSFLKPNIAIDWKPGDDWHGRLSLRRIVAQLDFFDFISIAELANDRVNAGNANLLPQRTWQLRGTIEKPVLGDGLVKVDLGLDRISLLQDQILTEDGFSAPGNIGTGRRRFISGQIDIPLARLGLSGTRLKLRGQVQRTRVYDPISEEVRNFSNFFPDWEWGVELRRDAGAFSYGINVQDRDDFTFFRSNEEDVNFNGRAYGTAFIEYRPTTRTSITLDVDNAFDTTSVRERLFFDPNRSSPDPSEREDRVRNRHVSFGLTLKQSFGGAAKATT